MGKRWPIGWVYYGIIYTLPGVPCLYYGDDCGTFSLL
jgi:hypothetical protein